MPTPLGTEEDHVRALGDEAEREELLDERAVDLARPLPVEAADGLDGADAGEVLAVGEAPAGLLLELDRVPENLSAPETREKRMIDITPMPSRPQDE